MPSIDLAPTDEARAEEFAGSLFMAALATMELANVDLGVRLGLYEALVTNGTQSSAELASATGTVERYVREWLEQQAVAGVLEVDDPAEPFDRRRFTLPNAHAHVLLDDDSEACMKPCAAVVPWVGKSVEIMTAEFRRGEGVAFGAFDLHDLQAAFTRPVFRHHLVQNWIPALPRVQAKLSAGAPVRIAEVGCEPVWPPSRSRRRTRTRTSTGTTWTTPRSGERDGQVLLCLQPASLSSSEHAGLGHGHGHGAALQHRTRVRNCRGLLGRERSRRRAPPVQALRSGVNAPVGVSAHR